MLKTMLKLALIILVALTLAELGREDPGYVLINYSGYVIETSILVLIIAGLVLTMAVALISYFVKPFWNRLKPIPSHPRQEKAIALFNEGMLALSDGDWPSARKRLGKLPKSHSLSLISTLGAARAAYELGKTAEAQSYLDQAKSIDQKQGGKNRHHLNLIEAQFAMASTDYALALRALNRIEAKYQNKAFWKLKARILCHTHQWHQLYALLPQIRQDKLFGEEELLQLEANCFRSLMHEQNLETIEEFWKAIPTKRRQLSEIAQIKFEALLAIGESDAAFALAQEQIQRGIDSQWAIALTQLKHIDWQTRYNLITKYFGNQASDVQVSKALGLIAKQGEHFSEALEHLKHALQLEPKDITTQLLVFEVEKEQGQSKSTEQKLEIITESVLA